MHLNGYVEDSYFTIPAAVVKLGPSSPHSEQENFLAPLAGLFPCSITLMRMCSASEPSTKLGGNISW